MNLQKFLPQRPFNSSPTKPSTPPSSEPSTPPPGNLQISPQRAFNNPLSANLQQSLPQRTFNPSPTKPSTPLPANLQPLPQRTFNHSPSKPSTPSPANLQPLPQRTCILLFRRVSNCAGGMFGTFERASISVRPTWMSPSTFPLTTSPTYA